jgi:hypothetical protein
MIDDGWTNERLVIYTVSERKFLRLAATGMWVGTEFRDHGILMRVTSIGKVYRQGKERLINVSAVEEQSDSKYVHGMFSWLLVEGKALPFPARAQSLVIQPCHRNPVRWSGQNKVWFHVFKESTHTYTGCFYAWASANLAFALHKLHHYKVHFNGNPRYPQVLEIVEEVLREELRGIEE